MSSLRIRRTLVSLLNDDELDITLVNNLRDKRSVNVVAETKTQLSVLVSVEHELASHRSISMSEVARHELIMPDEQPTAQTDHRWAFRRNRRAAACRSNDRR